MNVTVVDLVIKNGRIVSSHCIFDAGIAINEGRIVALARESNLPRADVTIDAEGKFVLPGLIDAHVHFREPGGEEREDFETGTKAAAAGGVTTVLEMPVSNPAVSSADVLERRKTILEARAVVDFGLYGGAGSHNIDEIPDLAEVGAIGFKTFMHRPSPEREVEFKGLYVTDDASLYDALKAASRTGLPSSVHCENNTTVERMIEELRKAGRKDAMAHAESRPNFVEAEAISKVIILSKAAGARAHIAHLSTKEGAHLVQQAKASGQILTAETCPHYLVLTAETLKEVGPYAKTNPPLRSKEDNEVLWRSLSDGTVDIIASDHAPFTKEEKDIGMDDIWKAPPGAPQIETMLPLLLTQVNAGKITIQTLVKVTSESVAKIFGLYPKKGAIQVGSDADLTIIDIEKETKVSIDKMYSKARDVTIYDGWRVKGLPVVTLVRGQVVMDHGQVIGNPGHGNFVRPLGMH